MNLKLVFATNNAHKLEEARKIAGAGIEILSLSDIRCHDEIPETMPDIEGNSLQKADYVFEKYGYPCFSDDTGLFVDALGGLPGVMTARYAGPECNPDANIAKLLEELRGKTDRSARFRTVVTYRAPGVTRSFEGRVEGSIAAAPQGVAGFGYDPVFVPDESGISFASMSAEAKNSISHRGRALKQLFDYLK